MNTSIKLTQFINTIYPDVQSDEIICLARPKTGGGFMHMPATERKLNQIEQRGNGTYYVGISTVAAPDEHQTPRRRKQDCRCVYVLMLDDIGTKAKIPPVEPSIILETSEGNYQYLYLLEPYELNSEDDIAHFEACMRGLTEAGYGEEGLTDVTRVYRLPGSVNTKEGRNNWQTRITWWAPERVWALNELMATFNVDPVEKATGGVKGGEYRGELPAQVEDPVLDWLVENGRLGQPSGDFYDIRCPWAHEHTTGEDKAGYSPLGHGEYPAMRTFNCFHSHCKAAKRDTAVFLDWVGENGGPKATVSGVRELDTQLLRQYLDDLTPRERVTLVYESLPYIHRTDLPDCMVTKDGEPKAQQKSTWRNVQYVIEALGVRTQFNMQTREPDLSFIDEGLAELMADRDNIARVIVDNCYLLGISSSEDIHELISTDAKNNRFHPMEQWILSKPWDEQSRFDALAACVTVSERYRAIWPIYLRKWLIQTVQAVRGWRRAKQIPYCLVLAGDQGAGKTSFLQSLVPAEFFAEGKQLALKSYGAKDHIMEVTRYPMVELGELETTFTKSEAGALKAFLSNERDEYREPYGRQAFKWPRCTAFGGSVNRLDFLVDETGSRRFWPVWCEAIKPHELDIQQLWAEISTWWAAGEQWWLTPEQEAMRTDQADDFSATDAAVDQANYWLDNYGEPCQPMSLTGFAKLIEVQPTRANLSLLRNVLEKRLGPRKARIGNVQKAWNVPATLKQNLEG